VSTIIISLIIFGILVIFHELGHFSAAKLFGVKVEEFAVGMGPKILGGKKGETIYSLRLIPMGGFCKMLGEDENNTDERSLNNKGVLERGAIFIAGSFMNIVLAILLFAIVFYTIGTPTTEIAEVEEDYPAYVSGLRPGDRIITINDEEISDYGQIESIITKNGENALSIGYERDGVIGQLKIQPKYDETLGRYRIGIRPSSERSFVFSISASVEQSIFITKSILEILGRLFTGRGDVNNLVGPVGIIAIVGETARNGLLPILLLAGQISLNLGIFNLLPIPALDGSRLMFLAIEAIRGKPINPEKEGLFHFVGFVLLILLAVFIGYRDVIRFTNFF